MRSPLFSPVMIGNVEIKNRFVHSATHEAMAADDGCITDEIIRRYRTLAKGEIGLIIPGHFFVHPLGKTHNRQNGIHADAMLPGLKRLVEVVHAFGGKIAVQLDHGGRQCPKKVIGQAPLAPSGHGRDPVSLDRPMQMDEAQIEAAIQSFVTAAGRASKAGADAVQLHAGHGFLINEFLSPFYNRRSDAWGGTPAGRFRFLKEIVTGIRGSVSATMPVLVKLNTNDFTPRPGITPDLAAGYAKWLVDAGVAAIEVTCGTYYSFHTIRGEIPGKAIARGLPPWMRPAARLKMKFQAPASRFKADYNLVAARTLKPVMDNVPLILVGGVRRFARMETMIAVGDADMVAMSRPLIREPFLVRRFREGRTDEASCISCNRCFAAMFNDTPIRCFQET